jgi:hypothetical protein
MIFNYIMLAADRPGSDTASKESNFVLSGRWSASRTSNENARAAIQCALESKLCSTRVLIYAHYSGKGEQLHGRIRNAVRWLQNLRHVRLNSRHTRFATYAQITAIFARKPTRCVLSCSCSGLAGLGCHTAGVNQSLHRLKGFL